MRNCLFSYIFTLHTNIFTFYYRIQNFSLPYRIIFRACRSRLRSVLCTCFFNISLSCGKCGMLPLQNFTFSVLYNKQKAHISIFYKNMQFFSRFYLPLTDCIFTTFYRLLLPFSAYADRLYRSNYRFLLNSMKYKKLEEKPCPKDYNSIIKGKPNSNGERSVHYVIHYHFYCSHLRKYVLHAERAAV